MEIVKREDITIRCQPGYIREPQMPGVKDFAKEDDITFSFDGQFKFHWYFYNVEGYDTYLVDDPQLGPIINELLANHGMLEDIKEHSSLAIGILNNNGALYLVFAAMPTCEDDDVNKPLPMLQTNHPFEIVMDDKEKVKFVKAIHSRVQLCPKTPEPETYILFTRDRNAIFDLFGQIYTGEVSIASACTQEEIDFISTLNSGELYPLSFFKDKGINPKRIVIRENTLEIPIFEFIGENWVFYKHNFDNHAGSIKIKETE